jgi:hypothetical protein
MQQLGPTGLIETKHVRNDTRSRYVVHIGLGRRMTSRDYGNCNSAAFATSRTEYEKGQ